MDLYRRGELRLSEMITQRVALEDVEAAFRSMERGTTLKSVVEFG